MIERLGLGPVFYYECLRLSRRWQLFAARALFVGILFAALYFTWLGRGVDKATLTIAELAQIGESFFYAIVGTQLVLTLLTAPLLTADAICTDRMRGNLLLLFTTDLSREEFVIGKLLSRLLPCMALVFSGLPVLALTTLLGGIDPEALLGAYVIIFAGTLVAASLTLTLSVWCRRMHEALLASYLILGLFVLAPWLVMAVEWVARLPTGFGDVLLTINPFMLAFAPYTSPGSVSLIHYGLFVAISLGLSLLLTVAAIRAVRQVSLAMASQTRRTARKSWLRRLTTWFPIDWNPVLWWEWNARRSSRWIRVVWVIYAVGAIAFSGLAMLTGQDEAAAFVNAFQVSIAMLLVLLGAVTTVTEDRRDGLLEMLLTTPLSSSTILWGTWLRVVPTLLLLTILPVLILALDADLFGRELAALALFLMILSYGCAVTTWGLAMGIWARNTTRALVFSVVPYLAIAAGWVFFLVMQNSGPGAETQMLAAASPWFGPGWLTAMSTMRASNPEYPHALTAGITWSVAYLVGTAMLFALLQRTFDASVGRIPDTGAIRRARPVPPSSRGQGETPE